MQNNISDAPAEKAPVANAPAEKAPVANASAATLPIVLVAGFLGAGKTTLMRALIADAHARGLRVGVIVNEFGVADVDSNLLAQADAEMLDSIAGGCACCSGQEEFIYALADAGAAYRDSPIADRLDAVLVECSGVADPITMLDAVTVAGLLPLVRVGTLVAVADALRLPQMRSTGEISLLMQRQIALADWLVLSKSDLAIKSDRWRIGAKTGEAALLASEEFLRERNAGARIERALKGAFDFTALWHHTLHGNAPHGGAPTRSQTELDAAPHAHYQTVNVPVTRAIERAEFEAKLRALPSQVWRAKGFLRLREDGHEGLYVMQFVGGELGGLTGEEDEAQWEIAPFDWPADRAAKPPLTLVFIGPQLDRAALEREFAGGNVMRLL